MSSNNLNNLIVKYNLTNVLKVILILIILFLVYRVFIETDVLQYNLPYGNYQNNNIYESFTASLNNGILYGNVISLLDPSNIPSYSGNTCTFTLNNTYRIDTIEFLLNSSQAVPPVPENSSFYNSDHIISISFLDGNGNLKNINAVSSSGQTNFGSPPTFVPDFSTNLIKLTSITDENGVPIFTSQIILTVNGNNNTIDRIKGYDGNKYIKGFGFYGGDKNLPVASEYKSICNTLTSSNALALYNPATPAPTQFRTNAFTFTQGNDTVIYSLQLIIARGLPSIDAAFVTGPLYKTDKPFSIKITYKNSLYTQNVFTINTPYTVRSDDNLVLDDMIYTYIFLSEPIIANSITFTIQHCPITSVTNQFLELKINEISVLNKIPSASDISDYKQTINILQSSQANNDGSNICPSINELVNTQTKTQQICDNLEYQDKIKSEKLRLERNKQYLLKLKDQQDQIDQLNSAIQELEDKRKTRAQASDQLRVLQYQKQKEDASSIRDLANQRLESQANNQLYMDVTF